MTYKPFRIVPERNLKILWSEIRIRAETGRDVEELRNDGVDASFLRIWQARRKQRDGFQDPPSDQRPSSVDISKNWIKGFEMLDEWIGSHVDDSYQIPLSFMIRNDPRPTFVDKTYASLDSEYAHGCPRTMATGTGDVPTEWYQPANKKLWDILYSIMIGHPSYGHIKGFRQAKDGYEAYTALRRHHLGENTVGTMAADVESQFASLSYTNEGRRWNFEKYVTKHVELQAQAKDLVQYGYAGFDEASRVRKLIAGIKTNKLDSVKAAILADRALQSDFDRVVALYKDFISQDKSMHAGHSSSQIAAATGRGNGRRNGGDDGGRRRQAKRANGQISQVNVTDRYYSAAEYAKLSKEERAALHKLRLGRTSKRQRGNDGSARTAALEAHSDDEDAKTVTSSNAGTSNRNHSALVRQKRPKKEEG